MQGSEGDAFPGAEIDLGGNMIGAGHNFDHLSDSDDEYFAKEVNGMKVNVYFTRNGNIIGKREVRIPKNGFYPTGKLLTF